MKKIAFQGVPGAYSHQAARSAFPDLEPQAFPSFEETLEAVETGKADIAIVPHENSIAGRVAEIHQLLCETSLKIVAEHFQPIHHCLLGIKGAKIADVKTVHSHFQGLAQTRQNLKKLNVETVIEANTAMAAQRIADMNDKTHAAIASETAAEIYGLDILSKDLADRPDNVTRFVVMAREEYPYEADQAGLITSFVFRVRNIPAALYKALGGFATNKINMIKLESHMADSSFNATQFYCEIEGHPSLEAVKLALDELRFFTEEMRILGVYRASNYRLGIGK